MRKKVISIVLLLALFAPAIVTYNWLQYKKHAVKREVKWRILNGIDKEQLTVFVFTEKEANNLAWKHNKEFEYQGQMYDVVDKTECNGQLIYWCFNDKAEAQLNKQILAFAADLFDKDPTKKEREQRLLQFYKSLFVQTENTGKDGLYYLEKGRFNHLCENPASGFVARFLHPPA